MKPAVARFSKHYLLLSTRTVFAMKTVWENDVFTTNHDFNNFKLKHNDDIFFYSKLCSRHLSANKVQGDNLVGRNSKNLQTHSSLM